MNNQLSVKSLSVAIEGKKVVQGISLTVEAGELHVIMGPNGSGKSSLLYGLMNHPSYEIKSTRITLDGKNITQSKPEDRAKAGLMLGFQNPIAVPGVSISNLLRTAQKEIRGKKAAKPVEFLHTMKDHAGKLLLDDKFLQRGINDGFSGGEKKKAEMLQMLSLSPKYALLDEIDTGLDIDALKSVAAGIAKLKRQRTGILLVTHYQRILKYLSVDQVHIMKKGTFVKSGEEKLIQTIEKHGYANV